MTDLDPFQSSFEETRLTDGASFPPGTYWLLDGPGITGVGNNSLERMSAHASAGGEFLHQVNPDGTLAHPERMWPGRGYEGMRVKVDGTVLS